MKRTTVFVDEALENELNALARRQRRPVAALMREAMAEYVARQRRADLPPVRFIGAGRSGHRDTATEHEALLWRLDEPGGSAMRSKPGPSRRPSAAPSRSAKKRTR